MPTNDFNKWESGFPYGGIDDGTNLNGSMTYWDNGFPYVYIFPTSGAGPSSAISVICNVSYSNVSKVSNVNKANISKIINIV